MAEGLKFPLTIILSLMLDRKSTRLNSSHSQISYAVFCLKKKNRPVLRRQVFRGYLRNLRRRYLLQLLNKPGHGLEGCDHFEDSYHEALSRNTIKRIRILSLDLCDRPL